MRRFAGRPALRRSLYEVREMPVNAAPVTGDANTNGESSLLGTAFKAQIALALSGRCLIRFDFELLAGVFHRAFSMSMCSHMTQSPRRLSGRTS